MGVPTEWHDWWHVKKTRILIYDSKHQQPSFDTPQGLLWDDDD